MTSATRYHVNPDHQVKRCTAISAASCPFGEEAHFTGTKDQAEFMQEMVNAGGGVGPAAAPSPAKSDYIQLPFRDDNLRAEKEADGKYTVKLANGDVLEEHADLVGGGDAAGLKRWAVKDSPYQANKIELPDSADSKITELRAVFRTNAKGALEHKGFIYKHADQDGWNAAHRLDKLSGDAPVNGMGYFGAIKAVEKQDEAFHDEAKASMREISAMAFYEDSKASEISADEANRVIHRNLNWEDRVYAVDPQLDHRIREKFYATPDAESEGKGQLPDEEDRVYIHEVRDSRNDARVDSIKVIWGARSWSTRARTFFSGGGVSAQKGLVDWLQENVA